MRSVLASDDVMADEILALCERPFQPEYAHDPADELIRTAYHEAGHSVAGHLVGIPLASVSTLPDQDGLGECTPRFVAMNEFATGARSRFERRRRYVDAHIQGLWGGFVAEALLTGRRHWGMAGSDLASALRIAETIDGADCAAVRNFRVLRRTERLLRAPEHWRAVVAVAAALQTRRYLSGRTVCAIIDRVISQSACGMMA